MENYGLSCALNDVGLAAAQLRAVELQCYEIAALGLGLRELRACGYP